MRARCFSVTGDCPPDTSPAGPCSRRPTDGAERCLAACRRPRRCIDSGRRLTTMPFACFEVALPLIAGQVSVDDGASLPLGGPLVLTLPSLPRNAVRAISQAPHRHRCPEPTLTCNWPPEFGKRRWLLTGSHVCLTWKLGRSRKTHGESQGSLDNRRPRDGNRELGNLLQNPIRHFLNWMLSGEIAFRFAEIVCTLPTSALTSKLNEWSAKIECTLSKVGASTRNKVR